MIPITCPEGCLGGHKGLKGEEGPTGPRGSTGYPLPHGNTEINCGIDSILLELGKTGF